MTLGAASAVAIPADAQSYPTRSVHLVFGLTAGSSSDVMARIVANKLGEKWKDAAVVIDNRPGAGGNIAAEFVAHSSPDGYTLLLSNNSLAIAPSFYHHLNYDPLKELVPVTELGMTPHVLCVNRALPVRSVKDLVALAKAKPGQLMYSSAGVGQTDQMAAALFEQMAGIQMTSVPYHGGPQALQAVMSGDVALDFPGTAAALPFIKNHEVRCLAVSTSTRSAVLPDLPTLDEAGIKGYQHSLWNGIFAPTGTPPEIIAKISTDFAAVLKDPEVVQRLATLGFEPIGSSPADFDRYFHAEVAKWAKVIKTAGLSD